ncbi:MAG: o-succinylbenzoate synthase [Acidobacteriota bacterium]
MKIDEVVLRHVRLPLRHSFETSFGVTYDKHALLVRLRCDGLEGWGECVAGRRPGFSYETVDTAWTILTGLIIPGILERPVSDPTEFAPRFDSIRGHPMAKASVEAALWDIWAQQQKEPLWRALGGTRMKIACGVSVGIQPSLEILLRKIETEVEAGYRKVKVKIKPGWDVEIVAAIRRHFPELPLMVDANAAYRLADCERLKRLDAFGLLMIEQPLRYDDLLDHVRLQAQLQTPVCLDESIRHLHDARHALELDACRVINIKMGRVGGLTEARRIHDLCREKSVPVWCGGMLETGIGRAHNVALSTLENFSLPGDVSASHRYFEQDLVDPPIEVTPDGYILPPRAPGLGYTPQLDRIRQATLRTHRAS